MKLLKYAVVVIALVVIVRMLGGGDQPVTAQLLATEASKRATLPLDLGDGFRLDSITAEGNTVVSTVTVNDPELATSPAFAEMMRVATTSDICRELLPARQAYIDAGLAVAKIYRNASGVQILRVDVNPADCT